MKGKKIFLSLMIIFAVTSIGLSVWLGLVYRDNKASQAQLENHYQQAYFVLLDETNNMEIKTAKLLVTSSKDTQSQLLYEIWKGSEVSATSLSALSSRDISVTNTMRFINQVGDFSLYLANQLAEGEEISEEHRESFDKIHDMLTSLGDELNKIKDEITKGYMFMENINTDKDLLSSVFGGLNESTVKYPQLIYDGPFSEALKDKEAKGLTGEDITQEKGQEIVEKLLENREVSNISFVGEWKTDLTTMNYEANVDGQPTAIQLAKKGGMPIAINTYRNITDPTLSPEECSEIAKQYLTKIGFENMDEVWICNDNSTIYINFAPVINNIIYYPDLIKVKIASDNGDILGLEARNYALNHTTRSLPTPALTADQAKTNVSIKSDLTGGRLALIPYEKNTELLTYEFEAEHKGNYYVYIDAVTGEEVNILYIISTTHGDLLM